MFLSFVSSLVVHAVGFLYPAYASFKSLQLEAGSERALEEQTRWLVYWVVYGIVSAAAYLTDTFLFWLPFYDLGKILLCLYLVLPQTQGALVLYHLYFQPKLRQYEPTIDDALQEAEHQFLETSKDWGQRAWILIRRLITDLVSQHESGMEDAGDRIQELDSSSDSATPKQGDFTLQNAPSMFSTTFYSGLAMQGIKALATKAGNAAATASSSLSPIRGREAGLSKENQAEVLRRRREALSLSLKQVEEEEGKLQSSPLSTTPSSSPSPPSPLTSRRHPSNNATGEESGVVTEDEFSFVERENGSGDTRPRGGSGGWLPWGGGGSGAKEKEKEGSQDEKTGLLTTFQGKDSQAPNPPTTTSASSNAVPDEEKPLLQQGEE